MSWQIGLVCNTIIAIAYFLIVWAIVRPLVKSHQLRSTYGSLMHGAKLFEDMRQREQQALELNDAVLQGMVVAKLALDLDDTPRARRALESAIDSASKIISDLLGPAADGDEKRLL